LLGVLVVWHVPSDAVDSELSSGDGISLIFIDLYEVPLMYGGSMWEVLDEEELVVGVANAAVEVL
jgi:hypothetical protein